MKKLFTKISGFLLVLAVISLFGSPQTKACNLSQTSLLTITPGPGLNFTVGIRVCFGAGVTGTTNGADGDTRTISFGWYTPLPGFTVNAFSPANVVGDFTTCDMPGVNAGALGPPYNTAGTVLYVDPGYYGYAPCFATPFTCITSTALCGNVHQQCEDFSFVLSFIPDSMRVFGVEGGGNALAGCYPDSDMMIDFTVLSVEWGDVEAITVPQGLQIKWSTTSESNSDYFILERSNGDDTYEAIANINAKGTSNTPSAYSYIDMSPRVGINRYRIVQVAKDGGSSYSPIAEGQFGSPEALAFTAVGPVPSKDFVNMVFASPSTSKFDFALTDLNGRIVMEKKIDAEIGTNDLKIDMTNLNAGIYFVRLSGSAGNLSYKLIKE